MVRTSQGFRSFGKTRVCRKNVEWKHCRSYRFSVLRRNERLERVLAEAPRGEVASRLDAPAALRDDPRRALPLRLERRERRLDELGGDAAPLEVVADQRVAGAAVGELLRPRAREALVVDVADPLERLERLLPAPRLADAALASSRASSSAAVRSRWRSARSAVLDGVRLLSAAADVDC